MQDKLQELTDKLFNEGLSKGREEGEAMLSEAKKKADSIIADATRQAETIISKAEKQAADFRSKAESDVKMASTQSLQAVKQEIESLILSKMSDLEVVKSLSSADFIKETVKIVAQRFSTQESTDISLVMPESLNAELEPFVKKELSTLLNGKVDVTFSKKIAGGFTIGPKDGSYFISLTDETFKSLISAYLRPTTRKFLFGD